MSMIRCGFPLYVALASNTSSRRTPEEKKTSVEVPLTKEGVEQAADWLNEQYESRKAYWLENQKRAWTKIAEGR